MGDPESNPATFPGYAPPSGAYDEMCSRKREVRPHWRYLIDSLASMGPEVLGQRQRDTVRMLRSDGATYNIYGTPDGLNRPWELDPVPLLVSSAEWADIETGLAQRAELLNLILSDLYGPRTLVRKRLLPAELIYGHPGYLRACVVTDQQPVPTLTLYAADLARGADGVMRVFNDRSQAPSGAGYALENRTVMSRLIPSLFRDSHPHRLAGFFRLMRTALAGLAPDGRDNPRVVVLTPGPLNETYFEHLYLANYLDYTLIEGADLTVRDGRVWLKSVTGLEPVDVILRRVDDLFCDPLELRPDSLLGVAGLTEAVRRGRVALANPLGSGVLENPGLMAFLPRLAKHFLGQELRLPSVATWWCGQPMERDYVLANLHKLVLRHTHRMAGGHSILGNLLSREELATWRERIKAQPHHFVGQELQTPSATPTLNAGRLEPRPAVLRSFLVASQDTYVVMPGGLTRVGNTPDSRIVSSQAGAVSKDTWVLASEPEATETTQTQAFHGFPESRETLPGVAAENLFWSARYAERTESMIRLLRAIHQRRNENLQLADPVYQNTLEILLRSLTHTSVTYPGFVGAGSQARLQSPGEEITDLVINVQRMGSLGANLEAFLKAAYAVRNLVSTDTRRVINDIGDEMAGLSRIAGNDAQYLQDVLDRIITALMAIAGATSESMSRELGWHFLHLGRRIERALQLAALLRATLVYSTSAEIEALLLDSILSVTESQTLYRRRYRDRPQIDTMLDLLLLDDSNARSLSFQVNDIRRHLDALPGQGSRPYKQEMRLVMESRTRLNLSDAATLAVAANGVRSELDALLAGLGQALGAASGAIADSYFMHVKVPHQLAGAGPRTS
ncbi:MAG TPA: circularly permuted type 2 ATP-grasp protein [Gammaproteobacteria bacterium]|nr:circularly permuted type 2 ATP-grasp protein [Gammaproteobacteria bacterium]